MPKPIRASACGLAALGFLAGPPPSGHAATFKTVFDIPGYNDGALPHAALIELNGAYYGTTSGGGDFGMGTVFKLDATTGAESILYSFKGGADGANPQGALIDVNGILFGTTAFGGRNQAGTVFKIDPTTGVEGILCHFQGSPGDDFPNGGLVSSGGFLFGTTSAGGPQLTGTIFMVDQSSGAETSLYTFGATSSDGLNPSAGLTMVGQVFYGTTSSDGKTGGGTIFSFEPATSTETPLYYLQGNDGLSPGGALLALNGLLYGTASQGANNDNGTVFAYNPATNAFSVLYTFTGRADGGNPEAGVIGSGNTLYGTTSGIVNNGAGSVFAIDLNSAAETTLHTFTGGTDGGTATGQLLSNNGLLYGTAQRGGDLGPGVVFSLDPATKKEIVLRDFSSVLSGSTASGLTRAGEALYGSTTGGGAFGYGAILRVDTKGGAGTILYSFKGESDGVAPSGTLVTTAGTLYGTTMRGGALNEGTVFKLDAQGIRTTLHEFTKGKDGATPMGGLVASGALLYGAASEGGKSTLGNLYSIDPGTGAETVLHSFSGAADGSAPIAPLFAVNGILYGTTEIGGAFNEGVVFAYDTASGTETTLFSFGGPSAGGALPLGQLTSAGGLLYGTTSELGLATQGTVFSLNLATNAVTTVRNFSDAANGDLLAGGVIDVRGTLYGTTAAAGLGYGTVFALDPSTGDLTTLYSFTGGADSGVPRASLVKLGGYLWGTTGAGVGNAGTVFKVKP